MNGTYHHCIEICLMFSISTFEVENMVFKLEYQELNTFEYVCSMCSISELVNLAMGLSRFDVPCPFVQSKKQSIWV